VQHATFPDVADPFAGSGTILFNSNNRYTVQLIQKRTPLYVTCVHIALGKAAVCSLCCTLGGENVGGDTAFWYSFLQITVDRILGTPWQGLLRFSKPPIISILIIPLPSSPTIAAHSVTLCQCPSPTPLPPPPSLSPPSPQRLRLHLQHPQFKFSPAAAKLRVVTLAHQCLFSIK
jgi:hypothetical protein